MMMILPQPSGTGSAHATIVIQTVHGNRMSVSMDQLPYAARGRMLEGAATASTLQVSTTTEAR